MLFQPFTWCNHQLSTFLSLYGLLSMYSPTFLLYFLHVLASHSLSNSSLHFLSIFTCCFLPLLSQFNSYLYWKHWNHGMDCWTFWRHLSPNKGLKSWSFSNSNPSLFHLFPLWSSLIQIMKHNTKRNYIIL